MILSTLLLTTGLAFAQAGPPPETSDTTEVAASAADADSGRLAWVAAHLSLRVDDRASALDTTVASAKERGGWFNSLSEDSVTVRVPAAEVEALLEELRGLGKVAERSFSSEDLTAEREDLVIRLASREESLARYLGVLETANPKAVVSVEREITRLIADIEQLKGRLQVVEDRGAYGQISVSFTYRDRKAPTQDGSSSFDWINTVNMADLLWDLEYGERSTRSVLTPTRTPAGFAAWRKQGRWQAVSPDGVGVRIRSARIPSKNRASVDFWSEALKTRMLEAGYTLDAEQTLTTDGGHELHVLELSGANGPVDQAFVVGIAVHGPRVIIAEASGEVAAFGEHRSAIVDSLQSL